MSGLRTLSICALLLSIIPASGQIKRTMRAEIITIGDELLIGQVVDTNSAWIAARLNDAGVIVQLKYTVGDRADAMREAIEGSLKRSDLVITTGGIGPTRDDITKDVVASIFRCGLVRHQPTYDHIERMTAERGFVFNDLNKAQALVPQCATVLHNANGTAPGLWIEREGRILVVLPGVPFEMEALMAAEVLPRLRPLLPEGGIVHRTMITSGIAESALAERIAPWEDALPAEFRLAYLPSPSGVRLRLSAYGVDTVKASEEIDALFSSLEKELGDKVVGYGDQTAEGYAASLLLERGATLAVAESCTGGRIASRFTAMPGASKYFLAGVVSYSNEAKINILGVDPAVIAAHGAVSGQTAEQMASGARRVSGADYAIATTGVAGPDGGTPEKPVGTVWIAVATPGGVTSKIVRLGNLRAQNIERAATNAINMLREVIRERQ